MRSLIRPYEDRDLDACLVLFDSNCPPYFAIEERGDFARWMARGYGDRALERFFVGEHETGSVVGCGGFYLVPHESRANLTWGMVHAALHRRGWGSALLTHRIEAIRVMGTASVVTMDTTQHTHRYFERHGFRVTKVTPAFYGPNLDRYDMQLTLGEIR